MNTSTPITVDPVDHSREHKISGSNQKRTSSQTTSAYRQPRYGKQRQETKQKPSRLGGIAQVAAGGLIALVGIPMLILPGPGLVAIGGGLALAAKGAKTLLNR